MKGRLGERHLGEEEICRWIAGDCGQGARKHLESCSRCRGQVAAMNEMLDGFQELVRTDSEQRLAGSGSIEHHPIRPSETGRSGVGWLGLGWAKLPVAALVTLFIAVAAWLPWHSSPAARSPQESVAAVDDTALLNRIEAEVSRTVPGPMEPLGSLMEWQPESQETQGAPATFSRDAMKR